MELYERGDSVIWTDPYVRDRLLAIHLDPETDAASRRPEVIRSTAEWILGDAAPGELLDLGCGPGLYAETFARRGWAVTGVDLNAASIDHARRSAAAQGLGIRYIEADYLGGPFTRKAFDLAVCIYCDFGALTGPLQDRMLERARDLLVPGGQFVFDVCGEGLDRIRQEGRTWSEEAPGGFWAPGPCYLLTETRHFPDEHAWGRKYIVLEADRPPRTFVLWDHGFTEARIRARVEAAGFRVLEVRAGLVPEGDGPDLDVLFVRAQKPPVENG